MQVYINNNEPPAFSCIHANLYFPQAHTCMTLQAVSYSILYPAAAHAEAGLSAEFLSTSCSHCHSPARPAPLLLPETWLNTATPSTWALDANYCPTSLILPSCPAHLFIFIMPENRVCRPKSKSR